MKTSELVNAARDHLHMGWAKKAFRTQEGAVCGISALERAAMQHLNQGGPQILPKAKKAIELKILELSDGSICSIAGYNDSHGIGQQDMLDLMDKVAIGLEEHGE